MRDKDWKPEPPQPGEPTCESCGCACFAVETGTIFENGEGEGTIPFPEVPLVSACCEATVLR
jgi:hypothetical protein